MANELFDLHLKSALLLVNEFNVKVKQQQLDPRAVRVALKFQMLVNDDVAKRALSDIEEAELNALARQLFKKTTLTVTRKEDRKHEEN
jgi:hypothetical protein